MLPSGFHLGMLSALAGSCREKRMRLAGWCKHCGLDCSRELPTSMEAECILGRTAARSLLNNSVLFKMRFWISAS